MCGVELWRKQVLPDEGLSVAVSRRIIDFVLLVVEPDIEAVIIQRRRLVRGVNGSEAPSHV